MYEESIQPTLDTLSEHPLGRVVLAAVTIFNFLIVYRYVNEMMPPRVDFYIPLDAAIPFLPWTIFIYMSMYLLFAFAAVYVEGKAFLRGLGVLVVVCIISLLFFVVFPAHYPRPDPSIIQNPLIEQMFVNMFAFDSPGNTFPSLHVGTTTTAVLMLRKTKLRWFFAVWGALICLSTLTVKQHFIADVAGGIALACLVFYCARKLLGTPLETDD